MLKNRLIIKRTNPFSTTSRLSTESENAKNQNTGQGKASNKFNETVLNIELQKT